MEIFNDVEFWKTLIPTTISLIITGIASLIIGVYLEKFKNRTSILTRKITSQAIAFSTKDDYWGHIKVYYNSNEAKNLNLFAVEIQNNSSKDLANVLVDIKVDNDSIIFANDANLDNNKVKLFLTNEFYQYSMEVFQKNKDENELFNKGEISIKDPFLANEIKYISTIRKFIVPVFNKGSKALFYILVENYKGLYPLVTADIIQNGIKLVDYEDETERKKRENLYVTIFAYIIFFIIAGFLLFIYQDSKPAIIWTSIAAILSSVFALIFYHIGKYVKRVLTT